MLIKEVMNIYKSVEKAQLRGVTPNVTIGRCILYLIEKVGNFTGVICHQRENNRNFSLEDLQKALEMQFALAVLFEKMKKSCGTVSDKSIEQNLKLAYEKIKSQYSENEVIWMLFKIQSFLGELSGKFNIRTQPQEYPFLIDSLMKVQIYLMHYITFIQLKLKGKISKEECDIIIRQALKTGELKIEMPPTFIQSIAKDFFSGKVDDLITKNEIKVPIGLPTPELKMENVDKSYTTVEEETATQLPPQQSEMPVPVEQPPAPETFQEVKEEPIPQKPEPTKSDVDALIDDIFKGRKPSPQSENIETPTPTPNQPSEPAQVRRAPQNNQNFQSPPLPDPEVLQRIKEAMGQTSDGEFVGKYDPAKDGDLDI